MRVPAFNRYGRFMQAAAFLVCGMIVGAAVFSAMTNDQYNSVVKSNIELRQKLATIENDRKIEEGILKQNVIKQIVVIFENQAGKSRPDILTEAELKKRLKKDLEIFLGRSIYEIDSDAPLARKLLDKKLYDDIEGKDYEINIKTMLVVDGKLQVWATAAVHLKK